jgi:hypothetical protein
MADERKDNDVEEIDIVLAQDEDDEGRGGNRPSNDMPGEDADQDTQVRQSSDANLHLGTQREPDAETTEARRTFRFENEDTLEAASRDSRRSDDVEEGGEAEDVDYQDDVARGDGTPVPLVMTAMGGAVTAADPLEVEKPAARRKPPRLARQARRHRTDPRKGPAPLLKH